MICFAISPAWEKIDEAAGNLGEFATSRRRAKRGGGRAFEMPVSFSFAPSRRLWPSSREVANSPALQRRNRTLLLRLSGSIFTRNIRRGTGVVPGGRIELPNMSALSVRRFLLSGLASVASKTSLTVSKSVSNVPETICLPHTKDPVPHTGMRGFAVRMAGG